MATYRLVWSGDGALDLSQVLDTRGRPIVLSPQQRTVSVVEEALKNPYIQRYLTTPQLKAELLDGPKMPEPPSTPTPPPSLSVPSSPPLPKPMPVTDTPLTTFASDATLTKEVTVEEVPAEEITPEEVMTKEVMTQNPLTASSNSDAGMESKSGFKGRKSGRK